MDQRTPVRAVLFDFDQTLVSLAVDWERARTNLQQLFAAHGFHAASTALGVALREGRAFAMSQRRLALWQQALACLRDEEMRGLARAAKLPGASELLSALVVRGVPFAIVSNNDSAVVSQAFARFDLPTPSFVVGRDMVTRLKPDPEGVRLALARLGASAGQCWFVGDSAHDIAAARAAMLGRILAVGSERDRSLDCEYVSTLADLIVMLDELAAW